MPALSAYIHSRGLKFGMYTDIGNASCGKGPGSYGHYAADATTFATEWQIDALKVDFCDFWFIPEQLKLWQQFRDALNATGRPIWLYTSPHSGGSMPVAAHGISAPWHGAHPYSPPPEWSAQTVRGLANSMMFQYVNLFDFWWSPHWGGATSPPGGLLTNIDGMNVLQERAGVPAYGSLSGAGFWADAQQLEVCNFGKGNEFAPAGVQLGMTLEEYRAHYTIWAMYASPMVLAMQALSPSIYFGFSFSFCGCFLSFPFLSTFLFTFCFGGPSQVGLFSHRVFHLFHSRILLVGDSILHNCWQHRASLRCVHPLKVLSADLTTIGSEQPECLVRILTTVKPQPTGI